MREDNITKILELCDDIEKIHIERLRTLARSVGILTSKNVNDKELLCATIAAQYIVLDESNGVPNGDALNGDVPDGDAPKEYKIKEHNKNVTNAMEKCDDIEKLPLKTLRKLAKSMGIKNVNYVDDKELLCDTIAAQYMVLDGQPPFKQRLKEELNRVSGLYDVIGGIIYKYQRCDIERKGIKWCVLDSVNGDNVDGLLDILENNDKMYLNNEVIDFMVENNIINNIYPMITVLNLEITDPYYYGFEYSDVDDALSAFPDLDRDSRVLYYAYDDESIIFIDEFGIIENMYFHENETNTPISIIEVENLREKYDIDINIDNEQEDLGYFLNKSFTDPLFTLISTSFPNLETVNIKGQDSIIYILRRKIRVDIDNNITVNIIDDIDNQPPLSMEEQLKERLERLDREKREKEYESIDEKERKIEIDESEKRKERTKQKNRLFIMAFNLKKLPRNVVIDQVEDIVTDAIKFNNKDLIEDILHLPYVRKGLTDDSNNLYRVMLVIDSPDILKVFLQHRDLVNKLEEMAVEMNRFHDSNMIQLITEYYNAHKQEDYTNNLNKERVNRLLDAIFEEEDIDIVDE